MTIDPEQMPKDIAGQSMDWLWWVCNRNPERFAEASRALQELIAMEATWTDVEAEGDEWRYRPYPLGKFGRLLWHAIKILTEGGCDSPPDFLEVGCGIGTKGVFAAEFMGVSTEGFDVVPKYIEAAKELAEAREVAAGFYLQDAMTFDGYGEFQIIFLNRPFRDLDREKALDEKVYEAMQIGSLLMLGNAVTQPPGWQLVAQDVACTLWIKECRCAGVEDFLAIDGLTAEATEYNLTCRLCGRDLVLTTIQ